jgi:hypothetical protein
MPIGGGQSGAPLPVASALGTIRLPLPNMMVDHQDVVYSAEELGLVAGTALAKFQSSSGSNAQLVGDLATGAATGALVQAGRNVGNQVARAADIFLQTQGLAVNPFLSVMFKSPAFKKHAFKWLLTPTNQPESRELDGLIKYFRFNQLPSRSPAFGGTMLSYPNIVVVEVTNSQSPNIGDSNSYWSYTFKPAVIESFAANYTPGGQPSHFSSTAAPTMAEVTMSLLEIEYWLQEDFGGGGNSTAAGQNNTFSGSIWDLFKQPAGPTESGPPAAPGIGTNDGQPVSP